MRQAFQGPRSFAGVLIAAFDQSDVEPAGRIETIQVRAIHKRWQRFSR